MIVFFCFAFPALAICVVSALYPERVTSLFAGSGRRRFTVQSAKEAAETIRTLEMQLAAALRPKPCPNCGHLAGWPTDAQVQASDRSDPAPHIHAPAPVDNGIRDTPQAAAETAQDTFLDQIARPGEEQMLARLKAVAQQPQPAKPEPQFPPDAVTQTLPAARPVTPVLPLQVKAGPGSADPTEVLPAVSRRAKVAVADHMGDAS